ncbi:hypothetical protein CVT26_013401 [Gymnopilus dilepis]|uniref:Uncharacterized protein n=1 Tax=Gymnopilus dilepis TaxID=231916 RepID=A0A409VV26_9AGAR|nr:hypothetical protein CVT26_013401 [Gymnopilus dilepis]
MHLFPEPSSRHDGVPRLLKSPFFSGAIILAGATSSTPASPNPAPPNGSARRSTGLPPPCTSSAAACSPPACTSSGRRTSPRIWGMIGQEYSSDPFPMGVSMGGGGRGMGRAGGRAGSISSTGTGPLAYESDIRAGKLDATGSPFDLEKGFLRSALLVKKKTKMVLLGNLRRDALGRRQLRARLRLSFTWRVKSLRGPSPMSLSCLSSISLRATLQIWQQLQQSAWWHMVIIRGAVIFCQVIPLPIAYTDFSDLLRPYRPLHNLLM